MKKIEISKAYGVNKEKVIVNKENEKRVLKMINEDCYSIFDIENPTKEMINISINLMAIDYLKNNRTSKISDTIEILAIRHLPAIIQYIENPTEEMKLEAVKEDGLAIQYIENPTEEMKKIAGIK